MEKPEYIEKKGKQWIGTTRPMNNGMNATIIAYEKNNDITIQFEDGYISKHKTLYAFKKGQVKNPQVKHVYNSVKQNRLKWVGCSSLMNNGQIATIVKYQGVQNIDVKFEDGYIAKHRTLCSFKHGEIRNPNVQDRYIQERLDMENTMSNGMVAKIIQYRTYNDIDIMFEDGAIVKSASFNCFKNGTIAHPDPRKSYTAYVKKKWLGQTKRMKNGLQCTITEYFNANNITVQFENGKFRKQVRISNFCNGEISTEEYSPDARVEKFSKSREGFQAKVIEYSGCTDFWIEFEDGKRSHRTRYPDFLKGNFSYPGFCHGHGSFRGYAFRGVNFELSGEKYYNVVKPNGESDVLTIREVMDLCNIVPLF